MTLAPATSLLSFASAEGGGSLTDIDLSLTLFTVILFALFALVIGKLGWKPLLDVIEERERTIRYSVESTEKARAEAQALLIQQKEVLREAGQQREEIVKRAFVDAEQARAKLIADAKAESERLLQRSREQIQREKELALSEIREQVADLAVGAAAKIVTSSLTPEVQRKLVKEYIDSVAASR